MPFINVKTNVKVEAPACDTVKSALGQAITAIPGKSEGWLMVGIEDEYKLYFKGNAEPAAMVEVSVFGNASSGSLANLTERITDIIKDQLSISPDRIYVKYELTNNWGWNGSNF